MSVSISGDGALTGIDQGLNVVGVLTASGGFIGNVTGTVNSSGIATFTSGIVVSAGSTSAPSITPTGDSNTGIFFPSADTVCIGEGGTEVIRVDSNGNIGIGTNNPLVKTHIVGSGDIIAIESTSNTDRSAIRYFTNGNDWELGARASSNSIYPNSFYLYDNAASAYRMVVDSSGRMFRPSQVNFHARGHTNGAGGSTRTVIYATVEHNIGSGYNSSTGVFTAPVGGYYLIGYGIFCEGVAYRRLATIRINGSDKTEVTTESPNDTYINLAYSAVWNLSTSDTVDVRTASNILSGTGYGQFYGYLLG